MVASIGNTAITRADLEAEYRLENFLEGKFPAPPPDAKTLAEIRDRLIEQRLLAEEAAAEGLEPTDPPSQGTDLLDEIRKKFRSQEEYASALQVLGLNEQRVLARLADRDDTLRMIDQRFRPMAWPESAVIETYYRETFVPEFARRNSSPPPPLANVEAEITEILVQKNIDRLLNEWLEEMKTSRRVRIHAD